MSTTPTAEYIRERAESKLDKDFKKKYRLLIGKINTEIYKAADNGKFECSVIIHDEISDKKFNKKDASKLEEYYRRHGYDAYVVSSEIQLEW